MKSASLPAYSTSCSGLCAERAIHWSACPLAGRLGAAIAWLSTTMCEFDPPAPNELSPATRVDLPSRNAHCALCPTMENGLSAKTIFLFSTSLCRLAGSVWCCIDSSTLISPATPAAASRWPMFDLTEPTLQPCRVAASPKASASPRISIGSPSSVPVPWHSM